MVKNQMRRRALGLCAAPLALAALTLVGCSGGFNDNLFNGDTGTFFSADQPVGNGIGRNYIQLNNGIPVRIGMEFTKAALTGLPAVAPDALATPYTSPLPSKTHGTPLSSATVFYSASRTAVADPPYFHVAFLLRNLQTTSPPYNLELAPPLLVEVPEGIDRITDAANAFGVPVPGAGAIYDDLTQPAGLPSATRLGQYFLYFSGHLNGFSLGVSLSELNGKQSATHAIKQPTFYPEDGYYPHSWTVRFDATRNTHVVELTDFKRADKVIQPGV